jgi:hypothetical protein
MQGVGRDGGVCQGKGELKTGQGALGGGGKALHGFIEKDVRKWPRDPGLISLIWSSILSPSYGILSTNHDERFLNLSASWRRHCLHVDEPLNHVEAVQISRHSRGM